MAPLMTRRIIKCNECRRFVAFHFNCVGCGSDRLKAVCVDFPGGFCRVCIFGREIKTSAPRHGVYLTTAKEPQTQKKKPRQKTKTATSTRPSHQPETESIFQPLDSGANHLLFSRSSFQKCLLPFRTTE